jgi:lantibiotic transport system ATP-binding protein
MDILTSNGLTPSAMNGAVSIPVIAEKQIARLNRQIVNSGIDVYQLTTVKSDLESIFINLVKH